MLVVSDTSPITSLLVVGKVDILRDIYQEVIISPAVADELKTYHKQLPSFVNVARAKNVKKVEALTAQVRKLPEFLERDSDLRRTEEEIKKKLDMLRPKNDI